jgi:hypothetical protein
MVCYHVSYELGLLWLFLMLHVLWPSARPVPGQKPRQPVAPPRQRGKEPKPFAGLTCKPHCDACDQAVEPPRTSPRLRHHAQAIAGAHKKAGRSSERQPFWAMLHHLSEE